MVELSGAFAAEVAEDVDRAVDFRGRLRQRLALLARHLLGDRRELAGENLRGLEQAFTAPRRRLRRPRRLRGRRRGEGSIDVVGRRRLEEADDLVDVRRVHVGERRLGTARDPFAANEIEKVGGHEVLYVAFLLTG